MMFIVPVRGHALQRTLCNLAEPLYVVVHGNCPDLRLEHAETEPAHGTDGEFANARIAVLEQPLRQSHRLSVGDIA